MKLALLCTLYTFTCSAQLSTDQRMADFRNLTDLYARRYAPIQWKLDLLKFDLLDLAPWTARIQASTNALDFCDLMIEYVGGLQDAHDRYFLPSDFRAYLGFTVDIYDGNVLIDSIDRTIRPFAQYPFQIGDQVLEVDGKDAATLVKLFDYTLLWIASELLGVIPITKHLE